MPPPEVTYLLQRAVLWEKVMSDDYGEVVVSSAVEISVRWNDKRREVIGPQGVPIAIDADAVVTQPIAIGSIMRLGTLSDWYGTGSGDVDNALMEVITYNATPDLKNRVQMQTVTLARFRGTLPQIV